MPLKLLGVCGSTTVQVMREPGLLLEVMVGTAYRRHKSSSKQMWDCLISKGILKAPLGAVRSATKRQNTSCLLSMKSYSDFHIVIYMPYYI